jgi:hypothetical protein
MTYRLLRQDAHPNCCIPCHANGFPIASLNTGMLVEVPSEPVLVRVTNWGAELPDFMERPFVVMSARMRDALDRAGVDNVQYIPALVQMERSRQVQPGFWLANILGSLMCVDNVASELDDGPLQQRDSFVVDPIKTYGLGLFRLAEDTRMLLAAPRVQNALHRAQLRGVLFQDTAHYRGGRAVSASELRSL